MSWHKDPIWSCPELAALLIAIVVIIIALPFGCVHAMMTDTKPPTHQQKIEQKRKEGELIHEKLKTIIFGRD